MLIHDFILIPRDCIPAEITYDLVKQYPCVHLSDDIIVNNVEFQVQFPASWESIENVKRGLSYHGITIILNENLSEFIDVLIRYKDRKEVQQLINLCYTAMSEKKDIIHFGI